MAISVTASDLHKHNYLHEALTLLEKRTLETWCAPRPDSFLLFQAAKIHCELSDTVGDRHHSIAKRYLRRMLQSYPEHSFAWQLLGDLFRREGKFTKAARCYIRNIAFSSYEIQGYSKLCGVLLASGRISDARRVVERQLELDPNDQISWTMKARIELCDGKILDAVNAAKRTVELCPDDVIGWCVYGRIAIRSGSKEAARLTSKALERLAPNALDAVTLRGRLAIFLENFPEAVRCCDRLMTTHHPNNLLLFRCLVLMGHYEAGTFNRRIEALKKVNILEDDDLRFSLSNVTIADAITSLDRELLVFDSERAIFRWS